MNRNKNWMQTLAENENLHAELIPGVPVVEICGRYRVLIENHCGIIGYEACEIQVKVKSGSIHVCGENLKLTRMCKGKLVITGKIYGVNLQERGQHGGI